MHTTKASVSLRTLCSGVLHVSSTGGELRLAASQECWFPFCMVWRWPSGKRATALYATLKCVSAYLCYYKYISIHIYTHTDSPICSSSPFLSGIGWGNEHWYWLQFPAMLRSTPLLYQESNSYQPRCRLTNSPGCCPGQQLMNTRGMNDAQRYFSSKEQVATAMIMMRLRFLVCRNVFLNVAVYSMLPRRKACHHVCASLACMHACTALCVEYVFKSACLDVLCGWLKACSRQVFTEFNDWNVGSIIACVPRDSLLSTEEVEALKRTFASCPDSR